MTCRTCDCADKAADTDEWVTFAKRPEILPLSAPAAPTPLAPLAGATVDEGKPVTFSWQHQRSEQEARARRAEAEVTRLTGSRLLRYVDENGYQVDLRHVGSATPFPWDDGRIVRVLTEDKPADTESAGAAYLSGPMTGLPDFNRPAFHAAAATLRAQGHVVINPAEVDLGPDATWADYMRIHLAEIARRVTQVFVLPGWESSRGAQLEVHVARALGLPVVPVLTEDKPAQEPVLPRQIKPEDVRPGMVIEQRKGEGLLRDRVIAIEDGTFKGDVVWLHGEDERNGWSFWLIEDAPAPEDPDAEAVERMAKEVHDRNCADVGCRDWDGHGESTRKAWRDDARVVLRNLRAQGFDVTARAEQ